MAHRLAGPLRTLTWPLYILFAFFWFKDNILPLKSVPGRPLLPGLLLAAVLLARLALALRAKTIRLPRPGRDAVLLAALILLAVAVRVPYFLHGAGFVTSDDAIPALMGKHIAEGKIAPISYYGQLYMGSLSSHAFALVFKAFGYSVFMLHVATLLFYLGFLVVEFLFLKEIVARAFAALVTGFLVLPIGDLIRVSFDDTSAYPLVLFLGTLLLFLSYRIAWKGEERRLAAFGFLTGLAFWTHQVTAGFILTAWLAVLLRLRPSLRRYAILASTTLVGLFPLLMQEAYDRFHMVRFLTAGEKEPLSLAKLTMTNRFMRYLLTGTVSPWAVVFILLVLAGFIVLAVRVIRRPEARPQALLVGFFALFVGVFIASGFSNKGVVRYLYPAYVCLPVLLLAGPWFALGRRRIAAALAVLAALLAFNAGSARSAFEATRQRDRAARSVLAAMEATGVKRWQAEYWTAYQLTAIAGEKLVVDAYTVNRYFPYRLDFYNRGGRGAYVFLRDSPDAPRGAALLRVLKGLGVPFHVKEVDKSLLIYGLDSLVLSPTYVGGFIGNDPPPLPPLRNDEAKAGKGYLRLLFSTGAEPSPAPGFQVRAEIPPYSSQTRVLSPTPSDNQFRLPLAGKGRIRASYALDFYGLEIPSSRRALDLEPPAKRAAVRKDPIVSLKGFGPKTTFFGRDMRVLEKDVRIELNRLKKRRTTLRLALYSPMQFEHMYWYGDYVQRMRVVLNGKLCEEISLRDKDNRCEIEIEPSRLRPGRNLLTLKFDYHLPLVFAPLSMTACLLESIEVEQDPS